MSNIGGSFKNLKFEQYITNRIHYLFPNGDAKVLDVGVGNGKYGRLCAKSVSFVDGIEVFEETLRVNADLRDIYRKIHIMDVLDFQDFNKYDIVIFGDVLEHIEPKQAQDLIKRIQKLNKEIIVAVPFEYEQEEINNNKYEIHKQADLTHEMFMERYEGFQCWSRSDTHGLYISQGIHATADYKLKENKNKICIYTIAKNEESFVNSFMDSASFADKVIVMDTGSTDNTVQMLVDRGATVIVKPIKPWRFDVARNEALKLVPKKYNVLVSVDLDEVFEPGWDVFLRNNWIDELGVLRYFFIQDHFPDGTPNQVFYRDKIHLNNYKTHHWKYRIHEVLTRPINQKIYNTADIVCHHYPDATKSRANYLPLLEAEYRTNTKDIRNLHLLGREYYILEKYEKAIKILLQMDKLYGDLEIPEVSDACDLIGLSYQSLKQYEESIIYFKKSIKTYPFLRKSHLNLATTYLLQNRFWDVISSVAEALKIKERNFNWSDDEVCWREKPYVLAFEAFLKLKEKESAETMLSEVKRIRPDFPLIESMETRLSLN